MKNKIKTIKAWVVINRDNEIVFSLKDTGYEIHESRKLALSNKLYKGEKVIPVLITPLSITSKAK